MLLVIGVATGIGKAAVYKFIPDQFPDAVGAVGGMVGLLGAMGGFVFPTVWGYLLKNTGLWISCWVVLVVISLLCLFLMYRVVRNIMREQAPDLADLIEQSPSLAQSFSEAAIVEKDSVSVDKILKQVSFFAQLNDEERKSLARLGRKREYADNEFVFREGDLSNNLYIILSGHLTAVRQVGTELKELAHFNSGGFFGELALIDNKPRVAGVRTDDVCELFLIDRVDFLNFVSKSPHALADLLLGLSSKMRLVIANSNGVAVVDPRLQIVRSG